MCHWEVVRSSAQLQEVPCNRTHHPALLSLSSRGVRVSSLLYTTLCVCVWIFILFFSFIVLGKRCNNTCNLPVPVLYAPRGKFSCPRPPFCEAVRLPATSSSSVIAGRRWWRCGTSFVVPSFSEHCCGTVDRVQGRDFISSLPSRHDAPDG